MSQPSLSVTAQVLGRALGNAVAGVESTLIGRFTCELWRLDVTFTGGDRQAVVLKRPKQEPNRDSMASERRFYERYSAALDSAPRYLGYIEEVDGILLEFVDRLVPFDWWAGPTEHWRRCIVWTRAWWTGCHVSMQKASDVLLINTMRRGLHEGKCCFLSARDMQRPAITWWVGLALH